MNISEKDQKLIDDIEKKLKEDPNIDHDWLDYRTAKLKQTSTDKW